MSASVGAVPSRRRCPIHLLRISRTAESGSSLVPGRRRAAGVAPGRPPRKLQVCLRPARRHREHLPARFLRRRSSSRLPARDTPGAPRPSLRARARSRRRRVGQDDRRSPGALGIEGEDRADLVRHSLRSRVVGLVDRDHVGYPMIPAFNACTESPEPGFSTSRRCRRSRSPRPRSAPRRPSRERRDPSGRVEQERAWSVASASPPRWPRVPIERMKTPGSRKWSESLIRSPRSAPCVNGLDGSRRSRRRSDRAPGRAGRAADQRRLADSRRARDPPRTRAGLGVEVADQCVGKRVGVLDQGDRPCERPPVARRTPAASSSASSPGRAA